MRSILSALFSVIVAFLIVVVLPLLLIVLISAILLTIGSLLTRVFPVTVFEATLILTLVAIPLVWFILRLLGLLNVASELAEEEAPESPSITERWIQVPRGAARRGRRR
jgi:hypothetical protein